MKYITHSLFLAILIFVSTGSQAQFTGKPRYDITVKRADTLMGVISVEMFPAIAPNHVRNWDSLVNIKFFDSIAFHRVIPGFMIQGGDPNSKSGPRDTWGFGGSETILDAEFSSVSHRRGILSAARTDDPNSATSQFFICVANPTYLDRQYTVYGKVVSGMNIADSIVKAKRDAGDNPIDKISMFITRTGSNDSVTTVPALVSPTIDSMVHSSKVSLRWNKVTGAMMYTVQLAEDSNFTYIILDSAMRQIDTNVTINNLYDHPFYWRVMANNGGNASEYSPFRTFTVIGLSAKSESNFTLKFDGIYPNPMSERTTIRCRSEISEHATITITDILGRQQAVLSHRLHKGINDIPFERAGLTSGIYTIHIATGSSSYLRTLVVK